jgi:tRNA A-37 threonylcarbamoyl transferase component Bud32
MEQSPEQLAGVSWGQLLAGKYRVEQVLGVGGMGAVVAAHHLQLDTKVAIKFLLPQALANRDAVARFAREARAAVKIKSEHVARVLDVGTLENGAPYMVMEYLQGADLSALLRDQGPLSVPEAIDFVLQASEAIAEAHGLGIVHRDLKPANLFCIRTADGRPSIKVLDFGISKMSAGAETASHGVMTQTSTVMGSPFYMSPEQMVESRDVDARTDIWALGVILYELLAGKVPFSGDTVPEVCARIAARSPPPLRDLRVDVPAELEAVVSKCLEKDRQQRYRDVAELAAALFPFAPQRAWPSIERISDIVNAGGRQATLLAPSSRGAPMHQPRVETLAPLGRTAHGPRRGKAVASVLAIGGAIAIVAGIAVFRRGPPSELGGEEAGSPPAPARSTAANRDEPAESGALRPGCPVDSTRCAGTVPQTCTAEGRWLNNPLTAGQCGAQCTPGSTLPRCCPECAGAGAVETCGDDGTWDRMACTQGEVCRSGACAPAGHAPHPRPMTQPGPPQVGHIAHPAAPDCDPNYTIDPQSGAHIFKPQCFGK